MAVVPGGPATPLRGGHREGHADVVSSPTRVLLVDDHQLLTDSLARLLTAEPDIEVVGIAASVAETRRLVSQPVDVVLMDYRLPDGTGADATRAIKARWPSARVVMLTAVQDDETVLDSIQAGADGYLTKDRAVDDVVAAVRDAHNGETLLPRSVVLGIAQRVASARDRPSDRPPIEPLTARELEVLRALADGLTSPQICDRLSITKNTLRTHLQHVMTKLHVHSKLEAVTVALRYRIVEPPRPEDGLY